MPNTIAPLQKLTLLHGKYQGYLNTMMINVPINTSIIKSKYDDTKKLIYDFIYTNTINKPNVKNNADDSIIDEYVVSRSQLYDNQMQIKIIFGKHKQYQQSDDITQQIDSIAQKTSKMFEYNDITQQSDSIAQKTSKMFEYNDIKHNYHTKLANKSQYTKNILINMSMKYNHTSMASTCNNHAIIVDSNMKLKMYSGDNSSIHFIFELTGNGYIENVMNKIYGTNEPTNYYDYVILGAQLNNSFDDKLKLYYSNSFFSSCVIISVEYTPTPNSSCHIFTFKITNPL
jgi:hypothetical protein